MKWTAGLIMLLVAASGELVAAEAGPSASPYSSKGSIDRRLVGNWRHTYSNSHMATDQYLSLRANGTFVYSTRTETKYRGSTTGPFRGRWTVRKGQIFARLNGQQKWTNYGRYKVSGRSMRLNGRLWER